MNDIAPFIEMIPLPLLRRYSFNARTHSEEQVEQVAASVREFGFTNPLLVDRDNQIIAGHCRLEAAALVGLAEVPCIRLDNITEAQKRAYVLADNKLAENAGWDTTLLRLELVELRDEGFDMGLIGFSEDELADLLREVPGESDEKDEAEEFRLTITSEDEAEIMALREIFGLKKKAGKVTARAVLALLPDETGA
ncbi:MAG: ParB/Srx family N-terminal domain-containing protein [Xanthomonadales bacterium]|jgi:ParB-like chromosome segregation protein Spo0J|nr:ParB/Srx family N-terminal domain-containing protein [Xanthomonadales bacterium]